MKTLAEMVVRERDEAEIRLNFTMPRLDAIPRIHVTEEIGDRLAVAMADSVSLITGVQVLLRNLGTDTVWIETLVSKGGAEIILGGVIAMTDSDEVEILLFSVAAGEFKAPLIVRICADCVKCGPPDDYPDVCAAAILGCLKGRAGQAMVDLACRLTVIAAGLAEPNIPAEINYIDHAEERRFRETNRKRRLLKRPLVLPCRPVSWNLAKVPAWEEQRRANTVGHREQARPHVVRGHQRHYRSGKVVTVRPHFRCGIPESMGRDYRVRA